MFTSAPEYSLLRPTREHRHPTMEYSAHRCLPKRVDSQLLVRPFPRSHCPASLCIPLQYDRNMNSSLFGFREKFRSIEEELTQKRVYCSVVEIMQFIDETTCEEFGYLLAATMKVQRDQRIATHREVIRHAHRLSDERKERRVGQTR